VWIVEVVVSKKKNGMSVFVTKIDDTERFAIVQATKVDCTHLYMLFTSHTLIRPKTVKAKLLTFLSALVRLAM
jgi:hypothetical protein